jgi:hypothetical protein
MYLVDENRKEEVVSKCIVPHNLVLRTKALVPTVGTRAGCCRAICMCLSQNLDHVLVRTVGTVKCYLKDV